MLVTGSSGRRWLPSWFTAAPSSGVGVGVGVGLGLGLGLLVTTPVACKPEERSYLEVCVELCSELFDFDGDDVCEGDGERNADDRHGYCAALCPPDPEHPFLIGGTECERDWMEAADCMLSADACLESDWHLLGLQVDSPDCGAEIRAWLCCSEGGYCD